MRSYRDQGAIGALLDEYEKALQELKTLISDLSPKQLSTIVDSETNDDDCRSIQTILTHVVSAGYAYVIMIRNHQGENLKFKDKVLLDSCQEYVVTLDKMFDYTCDLFGAYPDITLEEYNNEAKILTRWGQRYDVDQLMEHAIVHILRHRRQIERFLLRLG